MRRRGPWGRGSGSSFASLHPFIHIYASNKYSLRRYWTGVWPGTPNADLVLPGPHLWLSVSASQLLPRDETVIESCSFGSLAAELELQENPAFFSPDLIGPLFWTFVDKGIKMSVEYCIHHIQINTLHYHKDSERGCNIFSKLLIEQNTGGGKAKAETTKLRCCFSLSQNVCSLWSTHLISVNYELK